MAVYFIYQTCIKPHYKWLIKIVGKYYSLKVCFDALFVDILNSITYFCIKRAV